MQGAIQAEASKVEEERMVTKRWKQLRQALLTKAPSGKQLESFALLMSGSFGRIETIDNEDGSSTRLQTIQFEVDSTRLNFIVPIRALDHANLFSPFSGFLNTGNVRIWNSELAMAFWISKNINIFRSKSILEIGAGVTGLAGLTAALIASPNRVKITDGNPDSVASCSQNLARNRVLFNDFLDISVEQLLWGKNLTESFDIVLGADCTFGRESHRDLVSTLHSSVRYPDGVAYLFCPRRGDTLDKFLGMLQSNHCEMLGGQKLSADLVENYDDVVWQLHLRSVQISNEYNPDKDYPIRVRISWIK